jgi:hypothetical protein
MNDGPALYGFDLFGEPIAPPSRGVVSDRFLFPPFSVFDARQGDWQERKRAWAGFGIKGEVGRDAPAIHCPTTSEQGPMPDAEYTSIFDPTLCELLYRWFTPSNGLVLDPFAGGSVRGIVAGCLGRRYWGSELRPEQVEANREQAEIIAPEIVPEWIIGDANKLVPGAPLADFVFSCPPYGDLEIYSDDPADLSNMGWDDFLHAYRKIIAISVERLKSDRFAAFVVGDFRDKRGLYRNFVGETVSAFLNAGASLYNEAILVTSVGSASMRVTKQFEASRKFAKTHQNVLVFCKGDPRKATAALGTL